MENLTKENFFNQMTEKYPLAMANFCKWIDKYKVDNNWINLFNEKTISSPVNGFGDIELKAPKFHDLPFAMQVGIIAQYFMEHDEDIKAMEKIIEETRNDITQEFKDLDYKLYINKYPQYAGSGTKV